MSESGVIEIVVSRVTCPPPLYFHLFAFSLAQGKRDWRNSFLGSYRLVENCIQTFELCVEWCGGGGEEIGFGGKQMPYQKWKTNKLRGRKIHKLRWEKAIRFRAYCFCSLRLCENNCSALARRCKTDFQFGFSEISYSEAVIALGNRHFFVCLTFCRLDKNVPSYGRLSRLLT